VAEEKKVWKDTIAPWITPALYIVTAVKKKSWKLAYGVGPFAP
jgi:hypothetical protein